MGGDLESPRGPCPRCEGPSPTAASPPRTLSAHEENPAGGRGRSSGWAGLPTAVLNLEAHGDNQPGLWEEDDPREPPWAPTWALRILELPAGVDPARYYHFGLRGPRNDRGVTSRFVERGVEPDHIHSHRQIKEARKSSFDGWAAELARRIADGGTKVWIAVDHDVLDVGSVPDSASEPLGPALEEVIELLYQVGRAAGKDRLAGISIMATPHDARAPHQALLYALLYTLAGMLSGEG